MSIQEILASSGGALVILMTLVQIAPIKVNPWSAIGKMIGKALNGDVIAKLNEVQGRLDEHIRIDDERNADAHRVQILRFNRELLQDNIPHTQEDFIEALKGWKSTILVMPEIKIGELLAIAGSSPSFYAL